MSFCPECGKPVERAAKFCKHCGASLRGTRPSQQQRERPPRATFTPSLSTPEGQAAYAQLYALKLAQKRRNCQSMRWVGFLLLAIGGALHVTGIETGWMYAAYGVGGLFFLGGLFPGTSVSYSEHEYYSLPGSRDQELNHRCIQCGHRGIFRQGGYKQVTVTAQCSKCSQYFWTEHK